VLQGGKVAHVADVIPPLATRHRLDLGFSRAWPEDVPHVVSHAAVHRGQHPPADAGDGICQPQLCAQGQGPREPAGEPDEEYDYGRTGSEMPLPEGSAWPLPLGTGCVCGATFRG